MTVRRFSPVHRIALVGFLIAGLFVMHGAQATPSPAAASGIAVGAIHAEGVMALGHDLAAVAMPAAGRAMSAHSHSPAHHPEHAHPGGAVCLALLVMIGLVLLLAVCRIRLRLPRPVPLGLLFARRGPPRARPPTVYQLCVLRL